MDDNGPFRYPRNDILETILCTLFTRTHCFLFERYIYISKFSSTEYAASFAINNYLNFVPIPPKV